MDRLRIKKASTGKSKKLALCKKIIYASFFLSFLVRTSRSNYLQLYNLETRRMTLLNIIKLDFPYSPTGPFIISEPDGEFYEAQKRRMTNFAALKL